MATITEASRHAMHTKLEHVMGPDDADTLMEHLPPVGWADVATKQDLAHQTALLGLRFDVIDERFRVMDERFKAIDERFKGLDAKSDERFKGFDAKSDERFKGFDAKSDERFKGFDAKSDERFKGFDERFKGLDERFKGLDAKSDERFKGLDERFKGLDERILRSEANIRGEMHEAIGDLKTTLLWGMIAAQATWAAVILSAVKLL